MTLERVITKLYEMYQLDNRSFYKRYSEFLDLYKQLESIILDNPSKTLKL